MSWLACMQPTCLIFAWFELHPSGQYLLAVRQAVRLLQPLRGVNPGQTSQPQALMGEAPHASPTQHVQQLQQVQQQQPHMARQPHMFLLRVGSVLHSRSALKPQPRMASMLCVKRKPPTQGQPASHVPAHGQHAPQQIRPAASATHGQQAPHAMQSSPTRPDGLTCSCAWATGSTADPS